MLDGGGAFSIHAGVLIASSAEKKYKCIEASLKHIWVSGPLLDIQKSGLSGFSRYHRVSRVLGRDVFLDCWQLCASGLGRGYWLPIQGSQEREGGGLRAGAP